MDDVQYAISDGYRVAVVEAGEAWLWRLTTPGGRDAGGFAPDERSAKRCAAFAAFTLSAFERSSARSV
ncbi:hypothetical protein [Phenylobacterium sp.]|uniref:hypothetical protein n=1 Tax=Phenylobacterium sp. TaxID=1871053 RepID=UPI002BC11C3A|nr:hypothetical protein [Phenylobacterium sp.]HVI30973.1 hypothetical protein [Phenylobacterium sp.]